MIASQELMHAKIQFWIIYDMISLGPMTHYYSKICSNNIMTLQSKIKNLVPLCVIERLDHFGVLYNYYEL